MRSIGGTKLRRACGKHKGKFARLAILCIRRHFKPTNWLLALANLLAGLLTGQGSTSKCV